MSILPLQFPLLLAVDMLSTPNDVLVTDTRYDHVNDEDIQVIIGTRKIKGVVDKTGGRKREAIFGGSASDGDVTITTREILFISDTYNPGTEQKQSFFEFYGYTYRVTDVSFWKNQLGFNVYLGKRHIKQELV